MDTDMNNQVLTQKETCIARALQVLQWLQRNEVKSVVVCPGGRNAPFVEVLSKTSFFQTETFFEERSAAFYALGKAKKEQKPVTLITTSGTAVAETLPAMIEAHYQNIPLVVVSADRPKSYRGSGAPQAIEQSEILKSFCTDCFDLEDDLKLLSTHKINGTTHLNICFDEPLLQSVQDNYSQHFAPEVDESNDKGKISKLDTTKSYQDERRAIKEKLKNFKNKTLIILGALNQQESQLTLKTLKKLNDVFIYAEPHSQLKGCPDISEKLINCDSQTLNMLFAEKLFDSVVRIGGVPVLRFWRDLQNLQDINVLNFSDSPFSGIARIKEPPFAISCIAELLGHSFSSNAQDINKKLKSQVNNTTDKESQLLLKLSELIEEDGHIFLGNSLPIREWDQSAVVKSKQLYTSMRGANGIDGNIAYFAGLCLDDRTNYCIIGDLTTMYDLSSGFLLKHFKEKIDFKIVVINNCGGQIFKKLFDNEMFINCHQTSFRAWADLLQLTYCEVSERDELTKDKLNHQIIELKV